MLPWSSAGEDHDRLPPAIRMPLEPSPSMHDPHAPHPSASAWDGEEDGWGGGRYGEQNNDVRQHGGQNGSRLKWWDGFSGTIMKEGYAEGVQDSRGVTPSEILADLVDASAPQLQPAGGTGAFVWSGIPYAQLGGGRPSPGPKISQSERGATPTLPSLVPRSLEASYRELFAHTAPDVPDPLAPSLQEQYRELMAEAGGALGGGHARAVWSYPGLQGVGNPEP